MGDSDSRSRAFLERLVETLLAVGIDVYQIDHEDTNGQFEINFTYAEPLPMADMHTLFKQGVKEIAEQHGKAVTFMAKYAPGEAGNSCHIHMSLWKGGRNLFWVGNGSRVTNEASSS